MVLKRARTADSTDGERSAINPGAESTARAPHSDVIGRAFLRYARRDRDPVNQSGNTPGNSFGLLSIAPPGAFLQTSYWRYFNVASFSGSALDVQSVDMGSRRKWVRKARNRQSLHQRVPFPAVYPSA